MLNIEDIYTHEEVTDDLVQLEALHDKVLELQTFIKNMNLRVPGFDPMAFSDLVDDAWSDEVEGWLRRLEEAEANLDPEERKAIDEAKADYYCGLGVKTIYS